MFTVRVAVITTTGSRPALLAQLGREEQEVPALFEGSQRFAVYADPTDDCGALLYQEWTSRAAFEAYRTSEYFERSGAVLFPLLDGAPDSAYYEAELVGP